jgi:hypothetical protein
MPLSRALLAWNFRAVWVLTMPSTLLMTGYVLVTPDLLNESSVLPIWFAIVHSTLLSWMTARFHSPATAFLYTRGFSRDRLWVHRTLSQLICVVVVWLPACLVVWLGLRSAFQDQVLRSAYYPVFRGADAFASLRWLGIHVLLLGLLQYGPIRRAQPTCDRDSGYLIALAFLVFVNFAVATRIPWASALMISGVAICLLVLVYGSWRLHRRIEIYP